MLRLCPPRFQGFLGGKPCERKGFPIVCYEALDGKKAGYLLDQLAHALESGLIVLTSDIFSEVRLKQHDNHSASTTMVACVSLASHAGAQPPLSTRARHERLAG